MKPSRTGTLAVLLLGALRVPTGTALAGDILVSNFPSNTIVQAPVPGGIPSTTLVVGGSGFLQDPGSFAFGPDGYMYVSSTASDRIVRYYPNGEWDESFVCPTGSGSSPTGIAFDPADGTLLVAKAGYCVVDRLEITTMTWSSLFAPYSNGLVWPDSLCFHPITGRLLISDSQGMKIMQLSGCTPGPLCPFVTDLQAPEKMVWHNSELYVVDGVLNQVRRYDAFGNYVDTVAPKSTESPSPSALQGIDFGSDGRLYVGDSGNSRVLKYSVVSGVPNSSSYQGVFGAGFNPTDVVAHTNKRAPFPLVHGEVVSTYCPGLIMNMQPDPDGACVIVVDAREDGPRGRNWLAPRFWNEDAANPANKWTYENLGPVFGCCVDKEGNIFVAATTAYGHFPLSQYPAGPGAVYKIDRVSGSISVFLGTLSVASVPTSQAAGLTALPNTGPGLGDICYDPFYDDFYVSNLEDGKIYRVRDTGSGGVVVGALDPFGNDDTGDGTPGFPALGERVYALHKLNGRILLWSAWLRDEGNPNLAGDAREATAWPATWPALPSGSQPNNAVFRSAVVPTNFWGQELFKVMPHIGASHTFSSPVTDITDSEWSEGQFQNESKILFAERTYAGDYGVLDSGPSSHRARVLEYTETPGYPASSTTFNVGSQFTIPFVGFVAMNTSGGIAYDDAEAVWSTGDGLLGTENHKRIYGLQHIPSTGNPTTPYTLTSHLIDLDHETETGDKSHSGDVEFVDTTTQWMRGVVVCAGDLLNPGPCGNTGAAGSGWSSSISSTGGVITDYGDPLLSQDTAGLAVQHVPNGPVLFFQGTGLQNAIDGVPFGDGRLCVGGTLVRLKIVFAAGNTAQIPGPGQPSLSVLGNIQAPGWYYYQAWYRDSSPVFCTPSTFNLTNAIALQWIP